MKDNCNCKPDKTTLKITVIPASMGDEFGKYAPHNGAYYNTLVGYEETKAVYLYDSNGNYLMVEPGNYDELLKRVDGLAEAIINLQEALAEEGKARREHDELLAIKIEDEAHDREEADGAILQRIDEIVNSPDVRYIKDTYADLEAIDKSTIGDQDYARVLRDETRDGASTYYQYDKAAENWEYVGMTGPYYTQEEVDEKLANASAETDAKLATKQDTLVAGENIKTVNGESLLGEGNIEIQGGGGGGNPSVVDIVQDYSGMLMKDPSQIVDGDVIEVVADPNHNDTTGYYRAKTTTETTVTEAGIRGGGYINEPFTTNANKGGVDYDGGKVIYSRGHTASDYKSDYIYIKENEDKYATYGFTGTKGDYSVFIKFISTVERDDAPSIYTNTYQFVQNLVPNEWVGGYMWDLMGGYEATSTNNHPTYYPRVTVGANAGFQYYYGDGIEFKVFYGRVEYRDGEFVPVNPTVTWEPREDINLPAYVTGKFAGYENADVVATSALNLEGTDPWRGITYLSNYPATLDYMMAGPLTVIGDAMRTYKPAYGGLSDGIFIGNNNTYTEGATNAYPVVLALSSTINTTMGGTGIGYQINLGGSWTTALGASASTSGSSSTALGSSANASHDYSVALGSSARTTRACEVSLGDPNYDVSTDWGGKYIANVRPGVKDTDATNVAQVRDMISQAGGGGGGSVELLTTYDSKATDEQAYSATYINKKLDDGRSVALGGGLVRSANYNIAIGEAANNTAGGRAVALGNQASTDHYYSVALGYGAKTSRQREVSIGNGDPSSPEATKFLANVTDGELDQDAVTVKQLREAVGDVESILQSINEGVGV